MTKNIMHICFATDNNYAPYMGISIYSILKASDKNDKFHFHILDNSINKELANCWTACPNTPAARRKY